MARRNKGSNYERELCKRLSLWWTAGKHDDIFWRATTSGARATSRRRKGKRTAGNYGDIAVEDPIGAPLLDLFTIEIKRGYSKYTLGDLIDRQKFSAQQKFEEWIQQAYESWIDSGAFSWLLIHKRDGREDYVLLPYHVYEALEVEFRPYIFLRVNVRFTDDVKLMEIVGTSLKEFLKRVSPAHIRKLCTEI